MNLVAIDRSMMNVDRRFAFRDVESSVRVDRLYYSNLVSLYLISLLFRLLVDSFLPIQFAMPVLFEYEFSVFQDVFVMFLFHLRVV